MRYLAWYGLFLCSVNILANLFALLDENLKSTKAKATQLIAGIVFIPVVVFLFKYLF